MSLLLAEDISAEESRRQVWLARRREVVTSTDVPVLFAQGYAGSSPVLTMAQKLGTAPEFEPSLRMKIGRLMESVTRQVYTLKTDRGVVPAEPYQLHVNPLYPWLGASLDAVDTEDDLLELKNHGDWMKDESDIPGGWYLQCQTQLIVTGRKRIRLVVLIQGSDMKIFDLEPNAEIRDEILKRSKQFHEDMLAGRVPAPTVPEDNDNYKYIWTPVAGSTIELDSELASLGAMRKAIKDEQKELEERLDRLEARVKYALGENEVGILPDGGYWSWKPNVKGVRSLLYRGPK